LDFSVHALWGGDHRPPLYDWQTRTVWPKNIKINNTVEVSWNISKINFKVNYPFKRISVRPTVWFDLFNNDLKHIQSCQRQFIYISIQLEKNTQKSLTVVILYMHKIDEQFQWEENQKFSHLTCHLTSLLKGFPLVIVLNDLAIHSKQLHSSTKKKSFQPVQIYIIYPCPCRNTMNMFHQIRLTISIQFWLAVWFCPGQGLLAWIRTAIRVMCSFKQ